ncbi:MAG TPA: amylo-alpha-1,6-glucosidase [Candidatus Cloacimonadota bacterium]|nr:amylo-alpha-1,6-glucosidase [Candidatus Cloacimonadota bacterium]
MKKSICLAILIALTVSCSSPVVKKNRMIADQIRNNEYFIFTRQKALEIMKSGFNAGDGYREVWIRDYNTFIELAAAVHPAEELKENLMVFFRMKGEDGNILDGFTPIDTVGKVAYDFFYTDIEPRYAGHKNSVETDQESSLIQAVYKYIDLTSDTSILSEIVAGKTVAERLEWAMQYLMDYRFNNEFRLIYGATTADWGDVQPEHGWGVDWDDNTHPAIDIYDNAMFIIALDNMIEMVPSAKTEWAPVREMVAANVRKHLWDEKSNKFIPHIYLEKGSPFPPDFDENQIYYFGGTAIAIEAGLLSEEEIKLSLDEMIRRVKLAGAASIGLTLYPPYPDGFFVNKIMNPEYNYQNGGDWTWFGGRMIQQLIRYGFVAEAYEQVQPMVKRVKDNNGFFEWYSVSNEPRGSGTFRGEAGVLFTAIRMFEDFAGDVK